MIGALAQGLSPLWRLWLSGRGRLAVIGCSAWALGVAWMVFVFRYNAVRDQASDDAWIPMLVATTLVGLPGAAGILTGETIHELFRHHSTRMLPDLTTRLRRAALLLAACLTAVLVPLTVLVAPAFGWFGAAALSLAGFSAGVWMLVREGGGLLWLLRIVGYVVLIAWAPAMANFASSLPGLSALAAVAAVFVIRQRFSAPRVRASQNSAIATAFTAFGGSQPIRSAAPTTPGANDQQLPPRRTGEGLLGWQAARDFEQLTMAGSSQAPGRMTRHICATAGVAVFASATIALVRDTIPGTGFVDSTITLLADVIVGLPAVMPDVEGDIFKVFLLVMGITTAIQAILAARPLYGDLLYPISRATRGQLALSAAKRLAVSATLTTLVLGTLVGGILWLASGAPALDRPPLFVWAAALHLLVVPWSIVLFLASRRLVIKGHHLWAALVGTAMPGVLVFLAISAAQGLYSPHSFVTWAVTGVLFALLVVASFASSRNFVQRHFATTDLTVR